MPRGWPFEPARVGHRSFRLPTIDWALVVAYGERSLCMSLHASRLAVRACESRLLRDLGHVSSHLPAIDWALAAPCGRSFLCMQHQLSTRRFFV